MNKLVTISLASAPLLAAGAGALATRPGSSAQTPGSCCANQDGAPSVATRHTLTLDGAERVVAAAVAEARRRNAGGAVAVVDDGGNLVAFHRLDGTFAAGAEVSIGKARTAALFKKPTAAFEDSIKNGRIALLGVREMTPLQGGVPIIHDGFVVGAVGVSGAHSQQEDEQVATAGASAIAGPAADARK